MNKVAIGFIIAGGVLVTTGCIVMGIALSRGLLNPNRKMVTNEHQVSESFSNIDITTSIADVQFLTSEDDSCKVLCVEKEKVYHTVEVTNNTLTIKIVDELVGIEKWGGYTGNFKLMVYLPNTAYENLKVSISTGDTLIDGYTFTNVDITSSTGDIALSNGVVVNDLKLTATTGDILLGEMTVYHSFNISTSTGYQAYDHVTADCDIKLHATTGRLVLSDMTCVNATLDTSTGDMVFNEFVASGDFKAEASTGDITFKNSDAATLKIKTSTGDVTGNLLTDKSFHTKTSTGNVNVPATTGPLCDIETSTGDIIFTIGKK